MSLDPLQLTAQQIAGAFPGAKLAAIQRHWPVVRDALQAADLVTAPLVAYALATIAAETAGFVPLREGVSRYNTAKKPFDLYDGRGDLGNALPGDGGRYPGRGFIQLTGRSNYKTYGHRLGIDLEGNPVLANEPVVAAQLLALFIKDRAPSITEALKKGRLAAARKLVNGGHHGLDRFSHAYNTLRRLLA